MDLILSSWKTTTEREQRVDDLLSAFNGTTPLGLLPPGMERQPKTHHTQVTVGLSWLTRLAGLTSRDTTPLRKQLLELDTKSILGRILAGEVVPQREMLRAATEHMLQLRCYVREAVISLTLWLEVCGFVDEKVEPDWLVRFAEKCWWDFLGDRYEERMKYLTAKVQAAHLDEHETLPPAPSWICDDTHFLGGAAYAWFESRAGRSKAGLDTARFLELNNAITGLKKRQPQIPLWKLMATQEKWYKSLGSARGKPLSARTRKELKRVLAQIAGAIAPALRQDATVPVPSTTSRFESSTREGGTLELYRLAVLVASARHEEMYGTDSGRVFWAPVRALRLEHDDGRFLELQVALPSALQDILSSTVEEILVRPMMLPEPFKVRAISIGQGLAYMRTAAIQKSVHRALQSLPEFRVTKETPDHDIVATLTQVVSARLAAGDKWVSGDYTGATDNLLSEVSNLVAEAISKAAGHSASTTEAFRIALTGHTILLPDGSTTQQTNGQLMGANVSFPVLCIANLALTIVALRRVEGPRARRVGKSGIVINGDDIVFQASEAGIASWREVTSEGGLSPSVGKNFVSSRFLQLNSKMFRPIEHNGEMMWVRVPQASLQVLAPPRTVTFAEFCLSGPQWQQTFLDLYEGAERDRLNTLFVRAWTPHLQKLPVHLMNWFVPRQLGGFGLKATRPVTVTETQQHIAAYFRDVTTAQSAKLQKLRWLPVEATTTVHADTEAVVKTLVKAGVVEWAWLSSKEEELDTSVVTQALGLSGYSRQFSKLPTLGRIIPSRTPRGSFNTGLQVVDGVQLGDDQTLVSRLKDMRVPSNLLRRLGAFRAEAAPAPAEPPAPEGPEGPDQIDDEDEEDSDSWLYATLKLLKKAARSTPRSMSAEEIAAYVPKQAGYRVTKGWAQSRDVEMIKVSMRAPRRAPQDHDRIHRTVLQGNLGDFLLSPEMDRVHNRLSSEERPDLPARVQYALAVPLMGPVTVFVNAPAGARQTRTLLLGNGV